MVTPDQDYYRIAKSIAQDDGIEDPNYVKVLHEQLELLHEQADTSRDHRADLFRSLALHDEFILHIPNVVEFGEDSLRKSVPGDVEILQRVARPAGLEPYSNSRALGGYATTEDFDRQSEQIIQKGLDFTECINHGWYNDNHEQTTNAIIGTPTLLELHKSDVFGYRWYCEGFLFEDYQRADEIWTLAKAAKRLGRKLAYSIEGVTLQRRGPRVVKAKVRNIAITANPVNTAATWDILDGAMRGSNEYYKALTAGATFSPIGGGPVLVGNPAPEGHLTQKTYECPVTGKLFTSVEEFERHQMSLKSGQDPQLVAGTVLNKAQAIQLLQELIPELNQQQCETLYEYANTATFE